MTTTIEKISPILASSFTLNDAQALGDRVDEFKVLILKVIEWGNEKGLINPEGYDPQVCKTVEEHGELTGAILKVNPLKLKDSIGDTIVTVILSATIKGEPLMNLLSAISYKRFKPTVSIHAVLLSLASVIAEMGLNSVMNTDSSDRYKENLSLLFSCLFEICQRKNLDPTACLDHAYNVIKNRKGVMVDNVFVREETDAEET